MKALLAITARELRERWTLPVALFAWGFLLLFLVRFVDVTARPLATIAAVPAAWGIALLMGGSVIARDLADGRLAFFFARPVPWWSIAGGKLLAALLMAIAAPIASLLPAVVFDWNPAKDVEGLGHMLADGGLALGVAFVLTLVGIGHVASVVYRSRSTWAAVDFLLLGGCICCGAWLLYAFKRLGVVMVGPPGSAWAVALTMLLIAAVPIAAAAVQMATGRSDLQRGHKALSVTFWAGALVWLAVLGGLLLRERAVTPAALSMRGLWGASPDGRVVGLSGTPGPGRWAAFVYDTNSGRSLRLGVESSPAFSADGRRVAWLEPAPFWREDRPTEVQVARLEDSGFKVETVELDSRLPQDRVVHLVLSPKADRLAIVQPSTLSVYEIPSGRKLSANAASDGTWMTAAFLPDGQLRAFRRVRPLVGPPGSAIVLGRVEVVGFSGGLPTSAIRLETVGHAILASSPEEDLVLLNDVLAPKQFSLHDARTGRRIATFAGQDGLQLIDAILLSNGKVAMIEAHGPEARLRLVMEGQPDHVATLPLGSAALHELPDGLIAAGHFTPATNQFETLFFSADTAEQRGRQPGLRPEFRTLFFSDKGELVRFDPASRERRVLLPAAPAGSLYGAP
jgi:hypothetical protein